MAMVYKKLWKLLIDKGLNKTQFRIQVGISQGTLSKLSKGENVTTDVLVRICKSLECKLEDIVEYIEESKL